MLLKRLRRRLRNKTGLIKFSDVSIKPGLIEFTVEATDRSAKDHVWIALESEIDGQKVSPSEDAVAYAFSTLAGTRYGRILIDLPISQKALDHIALFTKADVRARAVVIDQERLVQKSGIALNFSGGFDSLAAYAVMPEDTKLISIAWGGADNDFAREEKFFKRFSPYTLRTNFRELGLDRASWTFMGVGALLYAEALALGYNVFGTILEATPWHFDDPPKASISFETPPFSFEGLKDIRYTNGLSEVGTALIASFFFPEHIMDSLGSLARSRSLKAYRKQLLLDAINSRFELGISDILLEEPDERTVFGRSFGDDFLIPYFLKYVGTAQTNRMYEEQIPTDVVAFAESHSLAFYERLNPVFCAKGFR